MRKDFQKGYTLIETMLTLTLCSVVAVTAIPAFQNTGRSQCDGAARKLVSDLSYARRLAQSRNALYGISFNAATDQYTVSLKSGGVETAVTDPLTNTSMTVDFTKLPGLKGVDIQSPSFGNTTKVWFNPQGIPQDASDSVLTTSGSVVLAHGGASKTVYVQPNTGEVSYQ